MNVFRTRAAFAFNRCPAVLLGLLAGLLVSAVSPRADDLETMRGETARIIHENVLLKRQVDLASSKEFYLLLDLRAKDLRIMLAGVTVRRFPVARIEVGVPGGFSCRPPKEPTGWLDSTWTAGQLDPPRVRDRYEMLVDPSIVGPPPAPPIPPMPEEAYPMPDRYSVLFDGHRALEIAWPDTSGSQPIFARLQKGLIRRYHALFEPQRDRLRVRVTLSLEDAAVFYRSLPLNPSLLILMHAKGDE